MEFCADTEELIADKSVTSVDAEALARVVVEGTEASTGLFLDTTDSSGIFVQLTIEIISVTIMNPQRYFFIVLPPFLYSISRARMHLAIEFESDIITLSNDKAFSFFFATTRLQGNSAGFKHTFTY